MALELDKDIEGIIWGVVALGAVALISYLIIKNINANKEKKQTAGANELAGNKFLTGGGTSEQAVVDALRKKTQEQKNALIEAAKQFPAWDVAGEIYDSHGVFDDDEENVYTQMAKLKTVYELFSLQNMFKLRYKKDLMSYLSSFLNTEELSKINTIIKNLKS